MDEDRVRETPSYWMMHGHPGHTVSVPKDGRWHFNGDKVKPTFTPSINEMDENGHHFFVQEGVVQYLSDKSALCCTGQSEFYSIPPWQSEFNSPGPSAE